jgi:hypothetical protein
MAGWTFGTLIADNMRVTAFCQNSRCNHNQRLDLAALAAKFGPDTPASHARRLGPSSEVHEMRRPADRSHVHACRAADRQNLFEAEEQAIIGSGALNRQQRRAAGGATSHAGRHRAAVAATAAALLFVAALVSGLL